MWHLDERGSRPVIVRPGKDWVIVVATIMAATWGAQVVVALRAVTEGAFDSRVALFVSAGFVLLGLPGVLLHQLVGREQRRGVRRVLAVRPVAPGTRHGDLMSGAIVTVIDSRRRRRDVQMDVDAADRLLDRFPAPA
ncbi:hypothetical protein [Demequina pelophila]|uniref:hypothetical protein n=1 Tax=Demequina pelophila TaxID=1638984 RepID=UPI000785CE51|nr:hypothetical protein [Demequina pelophila]